MKNEYPVPVGESVLLTTNRYCKEAGLKIDVIESHKVIDYREGECGLLFVVPGDERCDRLIPVEAYTKHKPL